MAPGSQANYYAFRAIANGQFVQVGDSGQLIASGSLLTLNHLFVVIRLGGDEFALQNIGNGKIITAEDAGASPLTANRDAVSGWETFHAIDQGGNTLAIQADVNGKYVSADSAGVSPLIANRDNPSSWEQFTMMPVIDMATVMTAFADRHPSETKQRTYRSNTGQSAYDNQAVFDRRVSSTNQIIITQMSFDGVLIHDWYYLAEDKVGIHGTFPMYSGASYAIWDQMIEMSYRYITQDMVGVIVPSTNNTYSGIYGSTTTTLVGQGSITNTIFEIGLMDTQGSLGQRWFVGIKGTAGWALEEWRYDLGPSVGVYDPEFGAISYIQTDKPDGGTTVEYYGNLQPYDGHDTVPGYFQY